MITLATGNTLRGKAGTAAVIAYTLFGDRKDTIQNYEPIAQGLLPSSTTILWTVPASTQGLISEIALVNTSVSDVAGVTFYVNGTAATNQITGTISIPAGGTATYNGDGWKIYSATGIPLSTVSGAAGGDLTGSYPNPTIKPDVALAGNPTTTTQSPGNNTTRIATTAFVTAADLLKQDADATLTALAGQNWAANAIPVGSGADTLTQQTAGANQFFARASTGNYVPKTISDAALSFTAAADVAAETALLNTATTALKGLQSAADKVKENNVWIDVVAEHGAVGDDSTNNDAAFAAAMSAAPAGGCVIYLPPGIFRVSNTITVNKPVIFRGAGRAISTIRTTHATNDVFDVTAQGAGFEQMRIASINGTTRTGGYGVDMNTTADVYMDRCDILYMHTGVHSGGALQFLQQCNIREGGGGASNGQAVLVDGTGDRYIGRLTTDNPSDPTGYAGIRVRRCSSLVIADCNIINSTNCLDIVPNGGAGTEAASIYAQGTFFDSSVIGINIVPATNSDTAQRMTFVRCWMGTHTQAGVVLGSASINVANTTKVDFIACEIYQNPVGIDALGIAEWSIRASRFCGNSTVAIRTAQGAQANVHNFSVTDNFIGAAGSFGANGAAFNIQAGTYGRYQIIDNRGIETNTVPGIVDNGTVTAPAQKNVVNNMGTVIPGPMASLSAAAQTLTASTQVVMAGTLLRMPTRGLKIGQRFTFNLGVSKTAAGVAASILTVKFGVNGTNADAAIATFTSAAGTAAAHNTTLTVEVEILTLGAAATARCNLMSQSVASGWGIFPLVPGSTATFDSTATNPFIHVDFAAGAATVGTGVSSGYVQN